jgi:hypothetical protein
MGRVSDIVRRWVDENAETLDAEDNVIRVDCVCGARYRYNHGDTSTGAVAAVAFMLQHEHCPRAAKGGHP